MTTERFAKLLLFLLLALSGSSVAGCGGSSASGSIWFEPAEHPQEIREAYAVFARRCAKCHTLRVTFIANVDDTTHWDRYVARMVRAPSSGITRRDAPAILKFLHYYTTVVRRGGQRAEAEPARENSTHEQ